MLQNAVYEDAIPASRFQRKKFAFSAQSLAPGQSIIYGRAKWYAAQRKANGDPLYRVLAPGSLKSLLQSLNPGHVLGACAASVSRLANGAGGPRKSYTTRHTHRVVAQLVRLGLLAPLGWEGFGRVSYAVLAYPLDEDARRAWAAAWHAYAAVASPHRPAKAEAEAGAGRVPAAGVLPSRIAEDEVIWLADEDVTLIEDAPIAPPAIDGPGCQAGGDIESPQKLDPGSSLASRISSYTDTETQHVRPADGSSGLEMLREAESQRLKQLCKTYWLPARIFDGWRSSSPVLDYRRLLWMRLTVEVEAKRYRQANKTVRCWPRFVEAALKQNYLGWQVDDLTKAPPREHWRGTLWGVVSDGFRLPPANDNLNSCSEGAPESAPCT